MRQLANALKDNDGTYNPAYLIAFVLTTAFVGWVSYLVFKTHVLPDFTGFAYLLGATGVTNAAHKLGEMFQKKEQ